jgi:WD40 repeat protein
MTPGTTAPNREQEALNKSEQPEAESKGQERDSDPLLALFYSPTTPTSFIVSSGGHVAGWLFECQVGATAVKQLPGMTGGVRCACHSMNGNHYIMGSGDGAVRIYATKQPYDLPEEGSPFWEGQAHDMHAAVTSVAMSFDGSQLISAASDGSMFTLRLNPDYPQLSPGTRQEGESNQMLCTLAACPELSCKDTGTSEYTIEQARQQLEEDALQAAAEDKKSSIREILARCEPFKYLE